MCAGTAEVIITQTGPITWEMHPVGDPKNVTTQSTAPVDPASGQRKRASVEEGWKEYERMILDPVRAGIAQRMESRRVWYASLGWFLTTAAHSLDASTSDSTDTDEAFMTMVNEELIEFARNIARGIA